MASRSFTVKLYGPPVSPLTRLSNSSGSRNDIALQIGWPVTSKKIRKAKLTCERFVEFVKRPKAVGGRSKEKNDNSTTSANHELNGSATTGLLAADDFCTGENNGLVSIGSHRLFLQSAGPARKPGEPIVIFMQGVASSSKGFAAVFRLLKRFVRVYLYDRTVYGQSDIQPDKQIKPTSTTIISELKLLLRNPNIAPPYIFVGHSWGGMLSREFFALHPDDIAGMVLIDSNQELTLEILDWREPRLWAIAGKVDFYEFTRQNKENRLTEEEWRSYVDDQATRTHKKQSLKERAVYAYSFPVLAEKAQLQRSPEPVMGDRPLSVVMGYQRRDWRRLYDAAVQECHGTEEERAFFLGYLQRDAENHTMLQEELLSLSNNCHVVRATESGHDVHLTQPELLVDEVKWVLEQCRNFPVRSGHVRMLAESNSL